MGFYHLAKAAPLAKEGSHRMAKRILVVDDERHIVRLVQVNLERAGYEILTAFDGIEALEQVKNENPDMVVLDVMMPRMDGFEVLKNLQADPRYQNIPVIMLTAKAQDADIFKGWASGVSSYLTKPFNPRELLVFVERIFQSMDEPPVDDENVWEV
jgi:two-component system alkaline phosphatase synthesis response regulator PhoP/two-component system response regulator VicR